MYKYKICICNACIVDTHTYALSKNLHNNSLEGKLPSAVTVPSKKIQVNFVCNEEISTLFKRRICLLLLHKHFLGLNIS